MSEEDWLTSGRWLDLWFHSAEAGLRTERKTRLFAAAACRRFVHRLVDPRCLRAVGVCERYADGEAKERELEAANTGARFEKGGERAAGQRTAIGRAAAVATHWLCYAEYKVGRSTEAAPSVHGHEALIAAGLMAEDAEKPPGGPEAERVYKEGLALGGRIQADILREVIGNPFRPLTLDPAWATPAVLSLARAAYDERVLPSGRIDPARLAVLSDALEEAGADEAILTHLRTPGPHVRGCWALDLILGKS